MNRILFNYNYYYYRISLTGTYSPSDAEEGRIIKASTSTKQRELELS